MVVKLVDILLMPVGCLLEAGSNFRICFGSDKTCLTAKLHKADQHIWDTYGEKMSGLKAETIGNLFNCCMGG